jgi:hypothetical protein
MRRTRIREIALTALAVSFFALTASSDEQDQPAGRKLSVPDISEKWSIRFEGYGGTPQDRSKFRVTLSAAGTMHVGKSRRGSYHNAFEGRLSDDERRKFFMQTQKIVKGYQPKKSRGRTEDGWNWTVEISSKDSSAAASYREHSTLTAGDPGFEELEKIIQAHLKKGDGFPE